MPGHQHHSLGGVDPMSPRPARHSAPAQPQWLDPTRSSHRVAPGRVPPGQWCLALSSANMTDRPSFTVKAEWSAWPEDLNPVAAARHLNPMATDDPYESLFMLLRTVPTTIGIPPAAIRDGSQMALDRDAAPDLLNLPMMCHSYLSGSANLLQGLYRVMRPRPKVLEVPRLATYPLIRGVIESSGQTVWLLGPNEQRERLRRLLQLEKMELDHDSRYFRVATSQHDDDTAERRSDIAEVLRAAAQGRKGRWRRLCDAAAALNISQSEFEQPVTGGWGTVISQAIAQEYERDRAADPGNDSHWQGRYGASIWFFISGMSHPSMSRAWAGSLHEYGEVGDDGLMSVKSSANPALVRDALSLALRLHLRAVRLWTEASGGQFRANASYWSKPGEGPSRPLS